MTSFAHTGSTFKNGCLEWNMLNLFLYTLAHVRINIANSSGEINILIFKNVIRSYRKYFWKVVETWNMQNKLL